MSTPGLPPSRLAPPVALVGLKAYLGHARTLAWFEGLLGLVAAGRTDGVSLVLAPSVTALAPLAPRALEAGIELAAQDCSVHPAGAWTGELPASLLAEVGAQHVMLGHVERRRLGDTDEVVAAKLEAAVGAGLAPIVCVGETAPASVEDAASASIEQLSAAIGAMPRELPVMVAYEPVWAIGAAEPAPGEHVVGVCERLRSWLEPFPGASLVYGGAAGPGTYREIAGVVDGLGLGRRVHELPALAAVLDELRGSGRADRRIT